MKKNVILLSVCQALMVTSQTLVLSTAVLVSNVMLEDKSLVTLPLALQFSAAMLTTVPASMLMRQIGRRPGFILGSLIGGLGGVLTTYAIIHGDFVLFCLGTVLVGIFNGFAVFYRFAAVDAVNEAYKSKAISYVMAGGVVAAFSGPNLANWTHNLMPAAQFAGSYAMLIGIYGLSMLVLFFVDVPKPGEHERHDRGRPLSQIMRQPTFLVAVIGGMLGYGIMSLVMTATPLAMHGHDHAFNETAFVIQWHVFGMFAPAFFTGALINRFGVLNIMLCGVAATAACVGINLLGTQVMHFWLALMLLGVGWNFLFIGATTLLTETYRPEEKAKTQAANDFLVFSTVTVAVLSAGALQYHLGWRAVNLGVLPLIAVILIAVVWLKLMQAKIKTRLVQQGA